MINIVLGILFAVCVLGSDVASEDFLSGQVLPVLATVLFAYFNFYGVLWLFERRLFPNEIRPSDYLDGKSPSLAEVGDEEMPSGEILEEEDTGLDSRR